MKATSSKSSQPQFELNALAPLRIRGLANALLENKNNPAEVERLANELLDLEPHILAMLIAESEKLPEIEMVAAG
jgi:hypothetical protein